MTIKTLRTFIIGSQPFFNCYDDYTVHDIDKLCIMSHGLNGKNSFLIRKDAEDYVLYPNLTKGEFIEEDTKENDGVKVGKYLIPEFAEYIGLTIDDLSKVKPLIDNLDAKHKYEKVIYDAYIENNAFKLTDEQRDRAYEEYKRARQ